MEVFEHFYNRANGEYGIQPRKYISFFAEKRRKLIRGTLRSPRSIRSTIQGCVFVVCVTKSKERSSKQMNLSLGNNKTDWVNAKQTLQFNVKYCSIVYI